MINKVEKILKNYQIKYPEEKDIVEFFLKLLKEKWKKWFSKENLEWHFTGSVLVVNKNISKILLMHHKKIKKWVFFWWHSEYEINPEEIAIRELKEEAWISIKKSELLKDFVCLTIFSVPERNNIAKHFHLDFWYVVKLDENINFKKQESEVNDIKWFKINELDRNKMDFWVKIILEKLENKILSE